MITTSGALDMERLTRALSVILSETYGVAVKVRDGTTENKKTP